MFFKVTETCYTTTSKIYTQGETDVFIFEASSIADLDGYFKDLSDYNNTNGLKTLVEIIEANEVEAEMEANEISEIIKANDM
jgi:hypothetical protein